MVCSRYPKEYKYYDKVLKKKCFLKLRNNVWESKIQWKLMEKADKHISLKIQRKYFDLWRSFRGEYERKRAVKNLAESYYRSSLGWRAILALRRNVEDCRISAKVHVKRFERILTERVWHRWRHYTMKRLKMKEIKFLLNKIREERLIVRLLNTWICRLREKRSYLKAEAKALQTYRFKALKKYFNSWKTYRTNNHLKKEINRLCKVYYENGLEERVLLSWKKYCSERKVYKRQMAHIKTFHSNYLIKRYLNIWREAWDRIMEKKERHKESLASNFLNRKLLKKSFDVLRVAAAKRKIINEKAREFSNFYERTYVGFYLDLWMEKWREQSHSKNLESKAASWREYYLVESYLVRLVERLNEKKEEKEELLRVDNYSKAIVLHRAFKGWTEVVDRKIRKRLNVENAAAFHETKVISKVFDKWKQFAILKSRKKIAVVHRENILLCRAFDRWKAVVDEEKVKMTEVNSLIERRNLELVRRVFGWWKDELVFSKEKMNLATANWDRKKLLKIFVALKENSIRKIVNKTRCSRNVQILNDILVKSYIFKWYEKMVQKKNLTSRIEVVRVEQNRRLIGVYFSKWREVFGKMKSIRRKEECFPEMRRDIVLKEFLAVFLTQLKRKRHLKFKEESAFKMRENLMKRKYMKRWMSFIGWKRETVSRFCRERKNVEELNGTVFESHFDRGDAKRRQPIIPDYMKSQINFNKAEVSDSFSSSHKDNTFTVMHPVNKRLPIVDQGEMFLTLNT